jgi:hypothetical protein
MTYPDQVPLHRLLDSTLKCIAGVIAMGLVMLLFRQRLEDVFSSSEAGLSRFAQRKRLAIASIFFGVIVVRLAVLPFLPVPVPTIHDEASYLLMADTFVHGRLANPPHPMWVSFETFHTNWFPKYASMYPPAQGAALALGQLLGHPWIGVLLSNAAMCAAILWMLQACLPARWAFLGGVIAAANFGIASYWMNSYWGGAMAGLGGAMVLGALARLLRRVRISDALIFGLGLAILANSRPYEGAIFCLPAAGYFLWWLAGKTPSRDTATVRIAKGLVPVSGILVLTAVFMGYYNRSLTGNALLFPHRLNARTYNTLPLFLWQEPPSTMEYRNAQFNDFYNEWSRNEYSGTWRDIWNVSLQKTKRYAFAYFWQGSLLLLPGFYFAFRDRRMRLLVVTLILVTIGLYLVVWPNAHYAAPLTCILVALQVQSIRHIRQMRLSGMRVGLLLSRTAILLLMLSTLNRVSLHNCDPMLWTCAGNQNRARLAKQLENSPGKHLVMVRYDEGHNVHEEWVFNGADLDGAKVLWAREIDAAQNAKLFDYFKDRQIWLIEPDSDNTELTSYPVSVSRPK